MKKKRYPLLPALAVAALMLIPIRGAAQVFNPYSVSYTATYSNDNLTIGTDTLDGVVYSTVSYNDLYNGGEPGMPSLPVDFLKFSVPYNATDFTVSVNTRMWHTQTLDHLLYPCQTPWLLDGSPAPPAMLPDSATYYSGNYYPSQMAWVVDEGFLAGENHIVTVAVLPFRYTHNASSNQLSMVRRCGITLRYRLSDSLAMQPIVRNDSLLREEGYELTQTMVVNPNSVKSYAPTLNTSLIDSIGYMHGIGGDVINGGGYAGGDGPGPVNPSLPDPGVDTTGISDELHLMETGVRFPYLIVTTSELKHAVRRIAALKRQKGYNVKVVTMDEVLSSQLSGFGDVVGEGHNARLTYTDEAGKLRQFIRNYYKYFGTKYVLLVGTDVPYRTITYFFDETDIKTFQSDLYFSDLTADWETDQFDKKPELFVGRILATSEEQINNYTDKLFRYELNPGRGDYSYVKNAFYSQGCDFIDVNTLGNPSEIDIIRGALDSIYPTPDFMIEPDVNTTGIPFPSGKDIVTKLDSLPYSFLSFHHHGCPSSIRTCGRLGPNGIIPPISLLWANNNELVPSFAWTKTDTLPEFGLNNLSNKYYPSICYSTACQTMPYAMPSYYEEGGLTMTFGESFTTGKDYGGPVFIGNTHDGYMSLGAYIEEKIAGRIINGQYKVGEANSYGKLDFDYLFKRRARYVVAVQNLLGDPSLELWTEIPQVYENISVTRTDTTISINGINTQPAIISISGINGGLMKRTSSSSDVTIENCSPNSVITLYKHNCIPFVIPLVLQKIDINQSRYVIASDFTAGSFVDDKRAYGNVAVKNGVEFEIEASGTVRLEDGFKVDKGATFAVYPSCF